VTLSLDSRTSFDRITEFIYLGSRVGSLNDFHRLRAHGVRACVDMKREGPDPWSFEAFLWLPTADQHPPNPMHLRIGMAFLRQCEQARMPVIVLCMAGVGRSSSLVLAHLLAGSHRGKEPDEALAFLCARRACVNPSPDQIAAAVEAARGFEALSL
jgi:hypothetical protein